MQCHTSFTGWLIKVGHKRIIDLYQPTSVSYLTVLCFRFYIERRPKKVFLLVSYMSEHYYYLDSFGINNVLQYHKHEFQSRFQLYLWFKQVDDPIAFIDYVIECVWPRSVDKYLVPGQFVICVESVNSNTQVHSQYSKGQGMSVHL